MEKQKKYFRSLDDLAFEGRNKTYGSYDLRKKYGKYIIISLLAATFLFLAIVIIPFLLYYFRGADMNFKYEELYGVDYTFIPPPEEDLNALAQSLAHPVQQTNLLPVVVDSPKIVEEKKPDEVPPQTENQDENQLTDTVSKTKGTEGQGQGTGDLSGVYTAIDVYPRFPGGDEARLYFLRNNIRYPQTALRKGIQGSSPACLYHRAGWICIPCGSEKKHRRGL